MNRHEEQRNYEFKCPMQHGGTQQWVAGDIHCTTRCRTAIHLDYHLERNHTVEGIGSKLGSETRLADFSDSTRYRV